MMKNRYGYIFWFQGRVIWYHSTIFLTASRVASGLDALGYSCDPFNSKGKILCVFVSTEFLSFGIKENEYF